MQLNLFYARPCLQQKGKQAFSHNTERKTIARKLQLKLFWAWPCLCEKGKQVSMFGIKRLVPRKYSGSLLDRFFQTPSVRYPKTYVRPIRRIITRLILPPTKRSVPKAYVQPIHRIITRSILPPTKHLVPKAYVRPIRRIILRLILPPTKRSVPKGLHLAILPHHHSEGKRPPQGRRAPVLVVVEVPSSLILSTFTILTHF